MKPSFICHILPLTEVIIFISYYILEPSAILAMLFMVLSFPSGWCLGALHSHYFKD